MATEAPPRPAPDGDWERLERATEAIEAPFALVDLDAMWQNAADMLRRAGGTPIRVASKSVRCRALLEAILARDEGFRGLMTFTLPETLWLHGQGFGDLLLAYPTADRTALAALGALDSESPPIVMVDSTEHLDLIDSAAGRDRRAIRVCLEMDTSFWLAGGRVKIGTKRSPVRTPGEAAALAREIVRRPGFELAGIMGYEGHIAGLGDRPPGRIPKGPVIERLQSASIRELAERRAAVVDAVRAVAPVELVNAGGTGSLESSSAEACVTEVTAGSGFYAPGLFDHYSRFTLRPAAMFALPVVRRPSRSVVTALGGGYLASGPADSMRLPKVHLPAGLSLDSLEGAGEVQTPLHGEPARTLRAGDRVYLRHAKAGELCERFDSLHLVAGGEVVDEVPTYRGERHSFL
ncbi:MAG TPA: amino acid deaminase/aldolase [Thermoleophilaceae bacterium]|nr:amino acid deaminase/aldolase [Thermoleophilaceae bacterium]